MTFDMTITFGSIATLVAGLIALLAYWLHRKDEKQKAASVLLLEIRQSEQAINQIRQSKGVSDFTSVLSKNHWKEYAHLFAKTFDQDEMELVNNFYTSCEVIEEQIKLMRSHLPVAMEEKTRVTEQKLIELADRCEDKEKFENEKIRILEGLYFPNKTFFEAYAPKDKLLEYINGVEKVSTTSAAQKLKNIGNAPWFKIFV